VGVQDGVATLKDSLKASYKNKHTVSIWSSNCISCYLHKWTENICTHKNLHMDVYSSFFLNC
jgi:hypothetical protein